MKKARATALGARIRTAETGISFRLTPMIQNELTGARNKDRKTLGRNCVPVLINQAALIIDQVHMTAAIIVTDLTIHFRGQPKQSNDSTTSIPNRQAISANTQPRYSPPRSYRLEWKSFTANV
ncbi:MAG: hypothetical protein ACYSW0_13845 [Planctomycetota bacterium]